MWLLHPYAAKLEPFVHLVQLEIAHKADTGSKKRTATLAALDPALSEVLPYLLGPLGIQEGPDPLAQMNPQVRRQRTLETIKRVILRESLEHVLVVIFEDLHWIDSETHALLDLLADNGAGALAAARQLPS